MPTHLATRCRDPLRDNATPCPSPAAPDAVRMGASPGGSTASNSPAAAVAAADALAASAAAAAAADAPGMSVAAYSSPSSLIALLLPLASLPSPSGCDLDCVLPAVAAVAATAPAVAAPAVAAPDGDLDGDEEADAMCCSSGRWGDGGGEADDSSRPSAVGWPWRCCRCRCCSCSCWPVGVPGATGPRSARDSTTPAGT